MGFSRGEYVAPPPPRKKVIELHNLHVPFSPVVCLSFEMSYDCPSKREKNYVMCTEQRGGLGMGLGC